MKVILILNELIEAFGKSGGEIIGLMKTKPKDKRYRKLENVHTLTSKAAIGIIISKDRKKYLKKIDERLKRLDPKKYGSSENEP